MPSEETRAAWMTTRGDVFALLSALNQARADLWDHALKPYEPLTPKQAGLVAAMAAEALRYMRRFLAADEASDREDQDDRRQTFTEALSELSTRAGAERVAEALGRQAEAQIGKSIS